MKQLSTHSPPSLAGIFLLAKLVLGCGTWQKWRENLEIRQKIVENEKKIQSINRKLDSEGKEMIELQKQFPFLLRGYM